MKQHKWHKEIKAWADGAEIEFKVGGEGEWMLLKGTPYWECKNDLFRIKPQPKEPQYLYVYKHWNNEMITFSSVNENNSRNVENGQMKYIGKIKLEVED